MLKDENYLQIVLYLPHNSDNSDNAATASELKQTSGSRDFNKVKLLSHIMEDTFL